MTSTTYGPSTLLPFTQCMTSLYCPTILSHPTKPRYNTFASAGSDATVSIWDHKVKKRLRQYAKYTNPIASIAFNCDGTKLAVGVSYTWDEGEVGVRNSERPMVCIKKLGDEIKVRYCNIFLS
jgi:WD40 repeat protein